MTELQTKVKHALDETRILVLGAQILLGFQLGGPLQPVFDHLPSAVQALKLAALALLLVTIGLLIAPAAFHRIVEEGHDTERLHRVVTVLAGIALLPFALALGIDAFVASSLVFGSGAALGLGIATGMVALAAWYGVGLAHPRRRPVSAGTREDERMKEATNTSLKDRIEHVLTETRIVLPGVQALLGFQLAGMLTEGFEQLPESSRIVHLVALSAIGLAGILLMMPAAYHRLVERGEDTERFHRFAGRVVVVSMLPLAAGLSLDFFVITRKVTASFGVAVAASAVAFVLFVMGWFGVMAIIRARDLTAPRSSPSASPGWDRPRSCAGSD